MSDSRVVDWLLEGDPAVRWRVMRDLRDADAAEVASERRRVGVEGWGRRLLDCQHESGLWSHDLGPPSARGLYMPKWISTHYSLLLLARLGLEAGHPGAAAGCRALLGAAGWRPSGGIRLWAREATDVCVCAMVLTILQTFEQDPGAQTRLRGFLLGVQLDDGGWNCERASRHGSFHTTLSVLEAFHGGPSDPEVERAAERGREFFRVHRLYRSHRTGEIARPAFTRLPLPHGWQFDALRGLGHFANVGAPRDERLADAVGALPATRSSRARSRCQASAEASAHWSAARSKKECGAPS